MEIPIIPEKTISEFYQNEFLSDAILKIDENELRFHKVILCAASEFFIIIFHLKKVSKKIRVYKQYYY